MHMELEVGTVTQEDGAADPVLGFWEMLSEDLRMDQLASLRALARGEVGDAGTMLEAPVCATAPLPWGEGEEAEFV